MTTLEYRNVQDILGQLAFVQLRRRLLAMLTGLAAVTVIVLGSMLVALPLAGLWPAQPPATLRWGLMAVLAVLWAGAIAHFLLRWVTWKQNPAQIARFIEEAMPEIRNDLINTVLLSRNRNQVSPEMVELAIREAVARTRRLDIVKSISLKNLMHWGIAAGAAIVLMIAVNYAFPAAMKRGWTAIFSPAQYLPQKGTVEILSVTPGDTSAFIGDHLKITATIKTGKPLTAEIIIDGDSPRPMMAATGDNTTFSGTVDVKNDFNYAVRVGDTRWPDDRPFYHVKVLHAVQVESITVGYTYPTYTKLPPKGDAPLGDGTLEAPAGSTAGLTLRLSEPVPSVEIQQRNGDIVRMSCTPGGRTYKQDVHIDKDGAYRIELRNGSERLIQQLPDLGKDDAGLSAGGYWRIHAIPDQPPKVIFLTPLNDVFVGPGAKVRTQIKVTDDYGIDQVQFLVGKAGGEQTMTDFDSKHAIGKTSAVLEYTIPIPADTPEGTESDLLRDGHRQLSQGPADEHLEQVQDHGPEHGQGRRRPEQGLRRTAGTPGGDSQDAGKRAAGHRPGAQGGQAARGEPEGQGGRRRSEEDQGGDPGRPGQGAFRAGDGDRATGAFGAGAERGSAGDRAGQRAGRLRLAGRARRRLHAAGRHAEPHHQHAPDAAGLPARHDAGKGPGHHPPRRQPAAGCQGQARRACTRTC